MTGRKYVVQKPILNREELLALAKAEREGARRMFEGSQRRRKKID